MTIKFIQHRHFLSVRNHRAIVTIETYCFSLAQALSVTDWKPKYILDLIVSERGFLQLAIFDYKAVTNIEINNIAGHLQAGF